MHSMITTAPVIGYTSARNTTSYLSSPKVSAVLITFNEEKIIRKTLSQLYWCDEIVVVDSYSTDNTVSVCREFGCKIYFRQFSGYGAQKRYAVSRATNDWVLCIDADEVLTDALVNELTTGIEEFSQYTGFSFRMNLVFLGKEFLHGKESDRYFLRLFNRQYGGITEDKVHESIRVTGPVKKVQHTIRHYSYTSFHQCMEKLNKYSTYSAEMAFEKSKTKSLLEILFGLPYNFFKYYLLERNFMNGLTGFYWSVVSSYYHFLKYVKLRELRKNNSCIQSPT